MTQSTYSLIDDRLAGNSLRALSSEELDLVSGAGGIKERLVIMARGVKLWYRLDQACQAGDHISCGLADLLVS